MGKKRAAKEKQSSSDSFSSGEMPKQRFKEKKVPYVSSPIPLPPGKKIHTRQVIPPVPVNKNVPDKTPSPPVDPD